MIMTFAKDAIGRSRQSMAAGAASLSDSSMSSPSSSSSSSSAGRQVGVVGVTAGRRVAAGPDRLDDSGHEVAEDLLGDQEAALDLRDRLGGALEQDDVVRALAVAVDGIGEAAAAPGRDLDDLSAGGDDVARGAVDDRGGSLVRRIRPEDEHEFIAAHGLQDSFQWDVPR